MQISIHATAEYELPADTFLILMVEPRLEGENHRVIEERLHTTPTIFADLSRDIYGNPLRRLTAHRGRFTFEFTAQVDVQPNTALPEIATEVAPQDLPPDVLLFTLPSRHCPSDRLVRFAQSEFGDLPAGGGRVHAVSDWVRSHTEYRYGTSDASTSAADILIQRVGVCRDFAHLVVALCRALGTPARYVSGYCLDLIPPDFHAWAQVYLDGRWHNVDATFDGVRSALVPIGWGRDAADVSLLTSAGAAMFCEQSVLLGRA